MNCNIKGETRKIGGRALRLGYEFYQQDTLTVAQQLLGKLIVRNIDGEELVCMIVETEAYMGPIDKASHAYQNRRTQRTEAMFLPGGYVYVYLIYGMYNCLNVVTTIKDQPEAVLIRGVEPLEGIETMRNNRRLKNTNDTNLTNGPGKLCQALAIDRQLNKYNLVTGGQLYIKENPKLDEIKIIKAKRINIDYAEEYVDKLWRFYIDGNKFVSKKKPER